MAYIVSVRARYCQILRFKARSNDGPGFGRTASIACERQFGGAVDVAMINFVYSRLSKSERSTKLTRSIELDFPGRESAPKGKSGGIRLPIV
jgi:hypothetical protein